MKHYCCYGAYADEGHDEACPNYQPPVPTGYVPRTNGWVQRVDASVPPRVEYQPPTRRMPAEAAAHLLAKANRPPRCPGCGVDAGALHRPGCLQKVVDDYLLMERKARAWDALRRSGQVWVSDNVSADLDALIGGVHPAQGSSTS